MRQMSKSSNLINLSFFLETFLLVRSEMTFSQSSAWLVVSLAGDTHLLVHLPNLPERKSTENQAEKAHEDKAWSCMTSARNSNEYFKNKWFAGSVFFLVEPCYVISPIQHSITVIVLEPDKSIPHTQRQTRLSPGTREAPCQTAILNRE